MDRGGSAALLQTVALLLVLTDDGPMRIIKGCTLGRCFLDSGATTALGLDRCDTSRPKFDCFFCCTGDACNVSSAPRVDIAAAKLIAVVLVTSLLTLL
ncbi:hypothetical protein FJT64_023025 [Amphibalanus amphitrite]|uniref:Protein sleepless n=1 Tax=Amphibalanus amphitrite TaxID=1232801 RepID=A0A6A4WRS4_AMPAM|nr:hypothetical protein FJT64_023025 [Amphibalanus amphitrite]